MGSEDLFHRRKNHGISKTRDSRSYKRIQNRREIRERILIVCEGERTEPNYFRAFIPQGSFVFQVDVRGTGYNTIRLVKEARRVSKEARNEGEPYDEVWCVMDRDQFPVEHYNTAIEIAKSRDFFVAYSNEAFELWYLLHFQYFDTGISRQQYIVKLSGHLNRPYRKNDCRMYSILLSSQSTALKNAETLYQKNNKPTDNPSTAVFRLVKRLNDLRSKSTQS